MSRRVFTFCSIASLVLCAASLSFGLWGFRESSDVRFEWFGGNRTATLLSDRGSMALVVSWGWPDARWAKDGFQRIGTPMPLTIDSLIVFDTTREQWTVTDGATIGTVTYRGVRTNIFYATLFTAIAPAVWLARRLRQSTPTARLPNDPPLERAAAAL